MTLSEAVGPGGSGAENESFDSLEEDEEEIDVGNEEESDAEEEEGGSRVEVERFRGIRGFGIDELLSHRGTTEVQKSPLDRLLSMTSHFDAVKKQTDLERSLKAQQREDGRTELNKKRKSRTAFTNSQIFELEKRFVYQKYLSPVDRDEIAQGLGLSNNQVITWFQNRRAKFKRDMEELKKEVAKKRESVQFHPTQSQLALLGDSRPKEGKDVRDPIRESHFPPFASSLPPSHPLFALLPPHILFPPRCIPSDAPPAISPPMRAQDLA